MLNKKEVTQLPPVHGDTGPVVDCPVCEFFRKEHGRKRDKDKRERTIPEGRGEE